MTNREVYEMQYRFVFEKDDTWLETYLSLRSDGDSHTDAITTIRGEIQMSKLMQSLTPPKPKR